MIFPLMAVSPTVLRILITTSILGFLAGGFGVLVVLKKQALVGDTLAHSALPGVVLTYLLFNVKRLELLLIGAVVSAAIAMIILGLVKRYSKIKNDAILALILAGLFGLGIIFLQKVQNSANAGSAGLETFIFGQTATILKRDMYTILGASAIIYLVIFIFWKEFKLAIFNPDYFNTLGFSSRVMDVLFSILIVLVVVLGIQMVGVVLISAMIIAPAVAARQWSNRLSLNFLIAGLIGAISGLSGTLLSDKFGLAAGPTIIIVLSTLVLLSLFFAPRRGILFKLIRDLKYQIEIKKYRYLINLYDQSQIERCPKSDEILLKKGFLVNLDGNLNLTEKGILKAKTLLGVIDHDD